MRDLQSEHISMLAAMLIGNTRGLRTETEDAVTRAIALQQEAKKQCEYLNRLADELDHR